MIPIDATTPGGLLIVLCVLVPFIGMLAGVVVGGRNVQRVFVLTAVVGVAIAGAIVQARIASGESLVYLLGGWLPPLGVALRADTLAVAMIATVAVVICGIAAYASADFATPADAPEARAPFSFWLLLLAVWGSLDLVFVSGDLFTLYVALELLTFAGVPLVCLDGRGETLRAALRYLLFALAGSVLYLLGAVLLYGAYGTLDIPLLAARIRPDAATLAAAALMTTGLLAKTALFPLHLWLPPAHAGAPPAASAVLSALVIKGSWFLVVRLWFDVLPGIVTPYAAQLVAGLGATVIVLGSIVALRQERLKLLVAYSTLAQIGYLFLMFPLAFDAAGFGPDHGAALTGGLLQAISHATAKAAMFMAAGLIYKSCGHDRIGELFGVARTVPVTVLAFGVGGVALMGVLPSGAYLAKKLLLAAADDSGQWWWDWVLQAGGFLTTSYVVLVLATAVWPPREAAPAPGAAPARVPVPRRQELAALGLAFASVAVSAVAVACGVPSSLIGNPLSAKEAGAALLTLAGGALLAVSFARHLPAMPAPAMAVLAPARRLLQPVADTFERVDALARRWTVAGLALLLVAFLFGAAMLGHP